MKYFEVSFDNFAGDCISCDVSVNDELPPFYGMSDWDIDFMFRLCFLDYRPNDEFVALIPIKVDSSFDSSKTVPFVEFFSHPQAWY